MEDYHIRGRIGGGAQGVVYEVQHIPTGKTYAMKVVCCANQQHVNMALKEIKVLLQLRHPHIVSYVDFFLIFNSAALRSRFTEDGADLPGQSTGPGSPRADAGATRPETYLLSCVHDGGDGTARPPGESGATPTASAFEQEPYLQRMGKEEVAVCLVMELCTNGDMQDAIKDAKRRMMLAGSHPIAEAQVLIWLEQCTAALRFIHDKGFLHRDLKPTNIFFDADRNVRIGDFGLAATVGFGRQTVVGTPYYLAPERMLQQRYNGKVDVWGLGVVMLELLTLQEQPINSMVLENPLVVESVVQQVTRMGFSAKLAGLLRDMLQRYPEGRPGPAAILHRLSALTSSPLTHLGVSLSQLGGMSCPRLPEMLCEVCEVETATVLCAQCRKIFCDGCDRARHRHPSRQSHERTVLTSTAGGVGNSGSASSASEAAQQILSLSRVLNTNNNNGSSSHSPAMSSEAACASMHNASLFGSLAASGNRSPSARHDSHAARGPSSPSTTRHSTELSFTHTLLARRDNSTTDVELRVPQDYATLPAALDAVTRLPHIRRITVAGNTVLSRPLCLTSALPDGLMIVGADPPPVIEVGGESDFALHCVSGRGAVVNFVLRHVGRHTPALQALNVNLTGRQAGGGKSPTSTTATMTEGTASSEAGTARRRPGRPTAVAMTGGEWRLHRCRISCVDGSGVTVGAAEYAAGTRPAAATAATGVEGGTTYGGETGVSKCGTGAPPPPLPAAMSTRGTMMMVVGAEGGDEAEEMGGVAVLEPVVSRCSFIDVTTAGVVVAERARGVYEGNTFSGCGFAAFLLRRESAPRIRGNRITDGAETGIFCHDASGTIEHNVIAHNAGCGVIVKGPLAAPVVRKNRVVANAQAGFFCCDRAAPFIADNEVRQNKKAGVLIKTRASPKVTKNLIEDGLEAGVYVFEQGAGIVEDNQISGNRNAGVLVTTQGKPYVIHNVVTKNAYEGVWVCREGGGTFCSNDLRGNVRGAMDIESGCKVTWIENSES